MIPSAALAVLMFSDPQLPAIEPVTSAESQTASPEGTDLPFRVPRDPSIPVVTMTFADPRFAPPAEAELAIYADGRVTATAEPASRRLLTARLPAHEWRKIQNVLFVENDLLSCQTEELSDAIQSLRRQRRRPQPGPDAAVTIFGIRGENMSHELRCHAVGLTATQLPDLPEVQRLYACQQCLQNVVNVVRAGGYERVRRTLETVNTHLEQQLPDHGPLSPDELCLVDSHPDGTRYLQFSRIPCPGSSSRNADHLQSQDRFLMVSVYERPGFPLEISIIGDTASR